MHISLLGAFGAGLLTFASPCVLPLAPVYLGLLAASPRGGGRPAPVLAASGFALGLSTVFVALGLAASSAASTLLEHRGWLLLGGGALLVLFGAKLLGILKIPFLNREVRPLFHRLPRASGPLGGFLMGAAFGLGWTPCVGPVLGAVLTYAASATHSQGEAATYLLAYAAGLSLPLVAASFAAPLATRALARMRRFTPTIERATGVLLIATGVLLATDRVNLVAPDVSAENAPAEADDAELICTAEGGCAAELGAETAEAASLVGESQVLMFTSPTCPSCARMRPVITETERRCAAPPGTVRPIDLASERGRALARHYAVHVVPTLLTVNARGEEIARLVGEQDMRSIARTLDGVRSGRCAI